MAEWHKIHDFFRSWGLREYIPDNEIVLEDHTQEKEKYVIPWKVVRHKVQERVIWYYECQRILGLDCFAVGFNAEEAYEKLQPILEEERQERIKNYKPIEFKTFTIPKINRTYPPL